MSAPSTWCRGVELADARHAKDEARLKEKKRLADDTAAALAEAKRRIAPLLNAEATRRGLKKEEDETVEKKEEKEEKAEENVEDSMQVEAEKNYRVGLCGHWAPCIHGCGASGSAGPKQEKQRDNEESDEGEGPWGDERDWDRHPANPADSKGHGCPDMGSSRVRACRGLAGAGQFLVEGLRGGQS